MAWHGKRRLQDDKLAKQCTTTTNTPMNAITQQQPHHPTFLCVSFFFLLYI